MSTRVVRKCDACGDTHQHDEVPTRNGDARHPAPATWGEFVACRTAALVAREPGDNGPTKVWELCGDCSGAVAGVLESIANTRGR